MHQPPFDSSAEPIITFWGAAQVVTGSMHVVEVGNRRVLLDCGLHQGKREESRFRNEQFPFAPTEIDAVLISHSHIDHCGNLPTLMRQGFRGQIYCTRATRDLLEVMLADSARIQEEDAAYLNLQRQYAEPTVEPLYTQYDVTQTLRQCVVVRYGEECEILPGTRFQFLNAGHVIGSAMVHLTFRTRHGERSVCFTGDLGRRGMAILKPTAPIPPCHVLVSESTYGNRVHEPIERTVGKLYDTINQTFDRGGKVMIPAFSLGRTQMILYYLHNGIRDGRIPHKPVYVDSPLAAEIVKVYRKNPECLTDDLQAELLGERGFLHSEYIRYIRSNEDSIALSRTQGNHIVVASSGMCDAGRIQQHLKMNVDDPRSTVILVSFQAPGTVGRRLLEAKPTVRFQGKDWNKWIDVVHLDGFSGHADREDFRAYLGHREGQIDKVRLIHGEREQAEALAGLLRELGYPDVAIPEPGERLQFTE